MLAGGNGDITARILSEQLKAILGQNVVVENLPGPGGIAAARATLSAPRDGQTLIWLHQICRCTGYAGIVNAIVAASEELASRAPPL